MSTPTVPTPPPDPADVDRVAHREPHLCATATGVTLCLERHRRAWAA